MKRSIWTLAGTIAGGLLAACLAGAAGAVDLEVGQKFDEWTSGCEKLPTNAGRQCFIFQKLTAPENGRELGAIAIGFPKRGEPPIAVVNLPLGMLLPAGVRLRIEGGEPRSYPVQFCRQDGCRAHIPLAPEMVAAMKAGLTAEVAFQDLQRKVIALPVSLKGFTRGLASLG